MTEPATAQPALSPGKEWLLGITIGGLGPYPIGVICADTAGQAHGLIASTLRAVADEIERSGQ